MAEITEELIAKICSYTDLEIKGFFKDYRWLSNFEEVKIIWMNLHFNSVEAAYQASKCISLEEAKKFTTMTGKEAKKASNSLVIRPDWKFIRYDVMAQLVFQKFLKDIKLRQKLLDTWPKYLEETNYWNDTYWGVYNNKGENTLGKMLMSTREYFKKLENDNN